MSEGPSTQAYPSLVAHALGLTMRVRPTNCHLTDDQLAISGAVVDPADNTRRDGQCLVPPRQARNLGDELAAAGLAAHPAQLVLLQDGADDIDFASCLENQLARVEGVGFNLGRVCVVNGSVTQPVATQLDNVRAGLARAIEEVAPHAHRVVVLDYYQPVPAPSQIADDSGLSGFSTNLVCTGIRANAATTYASAQVVLATLNRSVAGAVATARAHGVGNVTLVDLAHATDGHGMCTSDPWVFSGERIPDQTLFADAERIVAAKACTDAIPHAGTTCGSLRAQAARAESTLLDYVWRAAHPTASGQRAIAGTVLRQLRG